MRHYINERLVRRNSLLGKIFVWGGLGIVIGSVVISLQSQETLNPYVFMGFLGVFITQAGTMLTNRWGREPRLDEVMSEALKGLDDRFAMFHYLLRVDHALFTPNGVFVLVPRPEDGTIDYQEGKWFQHREKSGLFRRGGARDIAGLDRQAQSGINKLQRRLSKSLSEGAMPDVKSVLVFFHSDAIIKAQDSYHTAVHVKKLKAWLRKLPKSRGLAQHQIDDLASSLGL
jgi:hypothetical protein